MKFDIKYRWRSGVAFSADLSAASEGKPLGVQLGAAIKLAVKADADLTDADLTDAVLTDAVLTDAVLTDAVLTGAALTDADLTDADLTGYIKFLPSPSWRTVTGIGSDNGTLEAARTTSGLLLRRGCSGWLSPADFLARVARTHGDNEHGQDYRAAVDFLVAWDARNTDDP